MKRYQMKLYQEMRTYLETSLKTRVSNAASKSSNDHCLTSTPTDLVTDISSHTSPPSLSNVSVDHSKAGDYVKLLGLDIDDEEDVKDAILEADKAWHDVMGTINELDMSSKDSCGDDGPICKMMEALGTTYSTEDHGDALYELSRSSAKLRKSMFIDWYVRYMFHDDDDIDNDDDDNDNDNDDSDNIDNDDDNNNRKTNSGRTEASSNDNSKKVDSASKVSESSWGDVKWTVKPSNDSGGLNGKSWQCETCLASNPWDKLACSCCEKKAPHAPSLVAGPTQKSVTSNSPTKGFTFGAPAASTGPSSTAPSSSGFSFGAPAASTGPSSTAPSSSVFTFGAPAASTGPSSTAPSSSVFSFGSGNVTSSAVPTVSMSTASNGHRVRFDS